MFYKCSPPYNRKNFKFRNTKKEMAKKEEKETEKLLLENFILLQKKLVETLQELKELRKDVTKLISIFEKAKEEIEKGSFPEKELDEKLEKIIEQNKTIAEGIVALGEAIQGEKSFKKEKEKEKKKKEIEEKEDYELEPLPEFNF